MIKKFLQAAVSVLLNLVLGPKLQPAKICGDRDCMVCLGDDY